MPGVGDGGTGIGQTTSRLVEPRWKNGTDMRWAMVERSLSYAWLFHRGECLKTWCRMLWLRRGHHVGGILVMTVQATHGIVDEYAILNHIWLL